MDLKTRAKTPERKHPSSWVKFKTHNVTNTPEREGGIWTAGSLHNFLAAQKRKAFDLKMGSGGGSVADGRTRHRKGPSPRNDPAVNFLC